MTVPLTMIEYAVAVAKALNDIPEPPDIYVDKVSFGWYSTPYDQVSVAPDPDGTDYGLSFPGHVS